MLCLMTSPLQRCYWITVAFDELSRAAVDAIFAAAAQRVEKIDWSDDAGSGQITVRLNFCHFEGGGNAQLMIDAALT